jgi:hypothetical protein
MQAIVGESPSLPDPKKERIGNVTKIELESMVDVGVATTALAYVIAGLAVQSKLVENRALTKAFARSMADVIEDNIKMIRDGQKETPFAEQFRNTQWH